MGLDMTLSAERYISPYDFNPEEQALGKKIRELVFSSKELQIIESNEYSSIDLSIAVAEWRKANHIHAWFVDNCQEGEDDCRSYYVPKELLIELRDLCRSLLDTRDNNKALKQLPPQTGFFFGSTEIDEWYWEDLEYTAKRITELLQLPDEWNFHYRSSW